MNAYWKYKSNYIIKSQWAKLEKPKQNLKQLTSGIFTEGKEYVTGRSWKVEELRFKDDNDLHKLWYVLLKEKLALKSDQHFNSQNDYNLQYDIKNNLRKVMTSMARLKTVVDERQLLRNNLMSFLEFWYIRKMQKFPKSELFTRTLDVQSTENEDLTTTKEIAPTQRQKSKKIRGAIEHDVKTGSQTKTMAEEKVNEITEKKEGEKGEEGNKKDDVKKVKKLRKKNSKKKKIENMNVDEEKEKLNAISKEEDKNKISVLDQRELKIVANLKKIYTQKSQLLKDYVKNSHMLNPKEKRIVHAKIQSVRSKQAKEIFMKEMAAISYKLKNSSKQSENPNVKKLENLI
jgi:hypothetical protein